MNSPSNNSGFLRQVFHASLIVGAFIFVCLLLYLARYVVMMSLVGIGLGVLVSPLLTKMREKFRVPRALSALIFLIIATLFGTALVFAVSLLVADQVEMLSQKAPQIIKNLEAMLQSLYEKYPVAQESFQDFNVIETMRSGAHQLFKGVRSGFALISAMAFAIVIALYTSVGANEYINSFVRVFPASKRSEAHRILNCAAQTLRKWFRAQVIDMSIIGTLTLVGLWMVGADYWAVFGILTAIFGLIPYLGIIAVVILASLVTLASDPSMVPWVAGVFLVTQQIEGNFVLPIVMKEQVELPEMPLLVFMLLMGTWFGFLGVFLATPVFAVLRVLYVELYQPFTEKL